MRIEFPFLVTLSVGRDPDIPVSLQPVYDAVDVRENPFALELRLVNTTDSKAADPFPFYVPRDPTSLRELARVLLEEADRIDAGGNPFFT